MLRSPHAPIKCNSARGQNVFVPGNYASADKPDKTMTTLTITAKGQVTLKQSLLRHLGVGPGEKVDVDTLPEGRVVVKAARQAGTISDFIGCLSEQTSRRLTIDDINEITEQGWAQEN